MEHSRSGDNRGSALRINEGGGRGREREASTACIWRQFWRKSVTIVLNMEMLLNSFPHFSATLPR